MTDELQSLREEVAKLRERVAVLEAQRPPATLLDWTRPLRVGTPITPCPTGSPYTVQSDAASLQRWANEKAAQ